MLPSEPRPSAPAGLGGVDELEGHRQAGRPRARALGDLQRRSRDRAPAKPSDVPVTLNVLVYFAHLDRWLASSDPLFCEFSRAA